MIKFVGIVAIALLGIRMLSDRIITVDVNAAAGVLSDSAGFVLNGSGDRRNVVNFDPETGRLSRPGSPERTR